MSNLTFDEGLLKEHDATPMEGHNVVVFEQVGTSGEKFHALLPPGTPLKGRGLIGILRPHVTHFGIAVDAAPDLHLEFHEHVVLEDDAGHRFDLLFDLYYSVNDPRVLASHRKRDPLQLLRERVAQVIRRDVAQLQWSEVVHAFAVSAQEVVERRLPALRALAAGYGIALEGVELGRLLPGDATAPARDEESRLDQITRDERITLADLERERRIQDARNVHTVASASMDGAAQDVRDTARTRKAAVDARIDTMKRVAGQITTTAGFEHAFRGGIGSGTIGGGAASPLELAAGGQPGDAAALPAFTGGLGGVLHRMLEATQNISGSGTRQELRSALLHLAAEVLREDQGEPALVTRYADRARQLIGTMNAGLAPHELDTLHILADPAGVGMSLRS